MLKVILLFGGIFVFSTAAILKKSEESQLVEGCKSVSELWGSEDGTKFYFCIDNNTTVERSCPPNTFFIKNATVTGCIPLSDVADNCVYHLKLQPCEGVYLTQPQPHPDPKKFYLCIKPGVNPVELSCNEGAFVNQDGWLGCLSWTLWRTVRGCDSSA